MTGPYCNIVRTRVTNGMLEAFNGLIQSAKRRARGYRNPQTLILMAYLIAGKLSFNLTQSGLTTRNSQEPKKRYARHTPLTST
ncbi:transposase IS204/IS1001/IS1096/IS1165 family protein [mine drainage metagenome]|uniref:Transposase IS204/IS1001/IS1096/IS1165 family protein n=1 Tax=mine drainage metagenome TaxID=410659 RepID=T0Y8L2_9ZZZZ